MTDYTFDLFSAAEPEPEYKLTGSLSLVQHFIARARAGRLDAEEALALSRAEDELTAYRAHLQRRDTQVTEPREGMVSRDASSTSARAARNISVRAGTQRGRVLADIAGHDGATDHEIARRLSMLDSSVRPRRCELVANGYVIDSGRVRQHRGADWTIWTATAEGIAWFDRQTEAA
jgi:hypothetical protein